MSGNKRSARDNAELYFRGQKWLSEDAAEKARYLRERYGWVEQESTLLAMNEERLTPHRRVSRGWGGVAGLFALIIIVGALTSRSRNLAAALFGGSMVLILVCALVFGILYLRTSEHRGHLLALHTSTVNRMRNAHSARFAVFFQHTGVITLISVLVLTIVGVMLTKQVEIPGTSISIGVGSGRSPTSPPVSNILPPISPTTTFAETSGGRIHTWTNYANAGGVQGPSIAQYLTIKIACRVSGYRAADGNPWWYRIASVPWNNEFYASADGFYNNGHTSGSLVGTPWVDTAVPLCTQAPQGQYLEQEGRYGANTFANYHNASGMGTRIAAGAYVRVSCKVYDPTISAVNPDGYWYKIASSPWNNDYYAAANTFMNGDPWDGPYTHNTDFNVPDC